MFERNAEKKLLTYWSVWYYLGHVLFFWLIGLNYFFAVSHFSLFKLHDAMLMVGFAGHMAILALLPCMIVLPLVLFFPNRRFIFVLSAFIATLMTNLLVIDVIVYNLYHYHLNTTVLILAFHGITKDILGLSFREKIIPLIIIFLFLFIELCFARWLWKRIVNYQDDLKIWCNYLLLSLMTFIFVSYAVIVILINPTLLRGYIEKTRFLPFYADIMSHFISNDKAHLAWIRINHKNPLQNLNANLPLDYPKHDLHFNSQKQYLNLVVIGIDSWRFDMLNQEVTPNILEFSQKSWVFHQHVSGGNATGPGLFSLFYGLPANYMSAMEIQHRSPVLIDALLNHHYQMGIFSSAPLSMPPINRSVFQQISQLAYETIMADTVLRRDELVSKRFTAFIQGRDLKKPFFSFLFYDAAHSYCGTDDIPGPFQPITSRCNRLMFNKKLDYVPYLNRYKNAVLSIDKQVNRVLDTLKAANLLEKTVVVIVGDHGEEFDDENKGFYGHASNFSRYQIQTPLIIYWPGEKPQHFYHRTSHFDVSPTLMTKLLGCLNPSFDYALGKNLLDKKLRPYFIVSSYVNFGIVEPDRISTIYSAGNYQVENLLERDGDNLLDHQMIKNVLNELYYFYRHT